MSETRLSDADWKDIRAAYERDKWAGEWNSLPTAIDRALARLADQDAAGVEARVRALAEEYERYLRHGTPEGSFSQGHDAAIRGVLNRLRAALSGPADEHPADGTGA